MSCVCSNRKAAHILGRPHSLRALWLNELLAAAVRTAIVLKVVECPRPLAVATHDNVVVDRNIPPVIFIRCLRKIVIHRRSPKDHC